MNYQKKESFAIRRLIIGLLGVAFVVLKLIGVINWSWWWVTLPFWGVRVLALISLTLLKIITFIEEKSK